VENAGSFQFTITLDVPINQDSGFIDRLVSKTPQPLTFEMVLPALVERAFTTGAGTLKLHQKEWQSSS
jgi:hypothetical protein